LDRTSIYEALGVARRQRTGSLFVDSPPEKLIQNAWLRSRIGSQIQVPTKGAGIVFCRDPPVNV